jgi:hypothetical protein
MQLGLNEQQRVMKEQNVKTDTSCRAPPHPQLLHLVIMFHVERSFTERSNGSNSMEHQTTNKYFFE